MAIKLFTILHLIRFHNLFLGTIAVFVASYLLDIEPALDVFVCIIIVISSMSLGYIVNDIIDIQSDKINHPNRPLVQKSISKNVICMLVFFFISLLYLMMQRINIAAIYFLFLYVYPSLILYNFFFQKKPLLGNVIVSTLLGSIFLFTEIVLLQSFTKLLIPFFLTFSINLLREILKDLEDYDGDLMVEIRTIPVVFGVKQTQIILLVLFVLLIVGLPMPYLLSYYSLNYLILLIIFIEIPLIYSLFLLVKFPSKRTYKRLVQILKTLCGIGLIILMVEKG